MSIYSNVTDQDLIILQKLADQKKNQRALQIKRRSLKRTHDIKLAGSFSPITKKLDAIKYSNKKLGKVIKEPSSGNKNNQEIVPVEINSDNSQGYINKPDIRALPNSSIFGELMTKTLSSLKFSSNSLKIKASRSGPTFFGVPI